MKYTALYPLAITFVLVGCEDRPTPEDIALVAPIVATFTTIDANVTDIPPDYSINAEQADGELYVEENYFIELPDHRFALNSANFSIDYGREVIRESQINQYPMCTNSFQQCGDQEWPVASLWQWVGALPSTDTLVWQYIDDARPTQGYRWVMTEKPQQVRVTAWPTVLRPGQAQVFTYDNASDKDQLQLELVILAKENLLKEHTLPVVAHARWVYNPSAWVEEAGQLTLPGEQLDYMLERDDLSSDTDTAFWNVASVREIIKMIDGRRMQLTYQVNNLHPITIATE